MAEEQVWERSSPGMHTGMPLPLGFTKPTGPLAKENRVTIINMLFS